MQPSGAEPAGIDSLPRGAGMGGCLWTEMSLYANLWR